MKILITICARGGSKGIPGKNIKRLAGRSLIDYTLELAYILKKKRSNDFIDVVLSTDSLEIKNVVNNFNKDFIDLDYERPKKLATDKAGKIDAIDDVRIYMEEKRNVIYDYVLDLDVTSPLRTIEDIENSFSILLQKPGAYNVFSVSKADKSPYFNMVEVNKDGYYQLCKKGSFLTRQSAPKVYSMNASFYIYRRVFFEKKIKSAITNKSLIYETDHICFDLDHSIDFDFMEYLILNDKLNLNLL